MANNTTLDPGTGGDTIRDVDHAGVKTQVVGIDLNIGGAENLMTGAMPVTDNAGSLTVDNAGTFAVQDSQVITDNAGFTDGTSKIFPVGLIFDEVAGTALTENDIGAARMDSKRSAVGVIEDATTRGQRAAVSAGGALKVDGSAVTQPVSGTVTANLSSANVTNAGTFAVQDSEKVVDNAGFTDGTTKVQPSGYIFDEVAGTALTENDAAAARVDSKRAQVLVLEDATTRGRRTTVTAGGAVLTDASATTQPVSGTVTANAGSGVFHVDDNSASLTVDAPLATPVFTTATPGTTGGWTPAIATAQTTTVKAIKSSAAGTFGGYMIGNPNSTATYVQVFDVATAGAVTLGTTVPTMVYFIPGNASGGAAANVEYSNGVHMANGIQLACTTTATGSTAPATGLDMTILFK